MILRTIPALLDPDPPSAPAGGGAATAEGGSPPASGAAAPAQPTKPEAGDVSGITALAESFLTGEHVEPKEPKEKKEETTAKPKPAAPAKPKPAPRPAAVKSLTPEEIASAAAEGATRALAASQQTRPAAPAEPELSETNKVKVSVLRKMEDLYPDRYKGISKKFKQSVSDLAQYARDWEKSHPGEVFDEEATDPDNPDKMLHQPFFDSHDVDWDDEHYNRAMARIEAEEIVKGKEKELNERFSKYDRLEKLREAQPKITTHKLTAAKRFWNALGDEYKDVITEKGINQEKLAQMQQADPVLTGIMVSRASDLHLEVEEVYKLMNGLVDYDDRNPVHSAMAVFASDMETRLASQPVEHQVDAQGRSFLPAAQYYDAKLTAAQRARHWTLTPELLAQMRADVLATETRQTVQNEEEKYRAWAKSRGITLTDKPVSPREGTDAETADSLESTDGKPQSPSFGGGSKLAATRQKATEEATNPLQAFVLRSF